MQKANLKEFEQFYQFKDTPQNITAVFSNRKLNAGFVNQKDSQIKNNRQALLSGLKLKLDQLVCAKQVHLDNVYIAKVSDKGRGAVSYKDAILDTDSFITCEKNIALSIFIADCLPVFIVDKKNNVIALTHCGWKGTKMSILKKTVFIMREIFGSLPEDISAFFGPAIRKCCYQVGPEFLEYFKRGVYKKKNKIFLDLAEINSQQLKEIGILDDNIFDSGICTSCQNDKFFSYRKEKEQCGRQMALMVRR